LGDEMLVADAISAGDRVEEVSFSVKAGEVLGIAGLVGSGRTEMARAIFAADKRRKGEVFLTGQRLNLRSPSDAVRSGIGMVPEDRKQQGIIPLFSVKQNISLPDLDRITDTFGFIRGKRERDDALELMRKLSIKARDEKAQVVTMSGGNQQKVSLAKWINRQCRVMIIDEPTRGVDIGAKVEIYQLINDLSRQGVAIIIISSETSELTGICDRILVMRKGRIMGELVKKDFSEEEILRISIGA
jgi:ribose transport system ATP-binding protein